MSLLFSKVTVTHGNQKINFLVGGIPKRIDELKDWTDLMNLFH